MKISILYKYDLITIGHDSKPWSRKYQPTPLFLPGKIPWTEEPGGLQSMESQRVGHFEVTKQQNDSKTLSKFPKYSQSL